MVRGGRTISRRALCFAPQKDLTPREIEHGGSEQIRSLYPPQERRLEAVLPSNEEEEGDGLIRRDSDDDDDNVTSPPISRSLIDEDVEHSFPMMDPSVS